MILAWLACSRPDPTTVALVSAAGDADLLARWPVPAGRVRLHASWDRAQEREGFANADRGQFEGERTFDGRRELVLLDQDGPGAVVRTWAADPEHGGTLRIRLDGEARPRIEVPFDDWFAGDTGELRGTFGRGHLSLLPVPFREHALVTVDANDGRGLYWQLEAVSWPAGTEVTSFRGWPDTSGVRAGWAAPPEAPTRTERGGARLRLAGPGAIRRLRVSGGGTLVLTFDGEATVTLPLDDLAVGSWDAGPWASDGGVLTSRWTMPFATEAVVELRGGRPDAAIEASVGDWTWDDRSMRLHSRTSEATVDTRHRVWFPYLEVEGAGVYVGDVLVVDNPSRRWWGEGDDEVTVDGEVTHRGTGTEDWYGYAFCDASTWSGPLAAKPLDEAAGAEDGCESHAGRSIQARFRALDALPFERSLRVRFEVHHKDRATTMGLRAHTFWYQR